MQTFLPYADFKISAKVLDNKRLGKQRVEAYQILRVLQGKTRGWKHHPAVKMWQRYLPALALYGQAICEEWLRRGFKDSVLPKFKEVLVAHGQPVSLPPWVGNEEFHAAHRSNLLRKDANFYGAYFWKEPI